MTFTYSNSVTIRQVARDIAVFSLLLLFAMAAAYAQTTSTDTIGADGWTTLKSVWFGPAGLVFGALVFSLAVYFFFKDGVLAVLGVLVIGTMFFFIPAIVTSVQSWAKNI